MAELDRLEVYGVIVDVVGDRAVLVKHGHAPVLADGEIVLDILRDSEVGDLTEDGVLELFLWACDEGDDGTDSEEPGDQGDGSGYDEDDEGDDGFQAS